MIAAKSSQFFIFNERLRAKAGSAAARAWSLFVVLSFVLLFSTAATAGGPTSEKLAWKISDWTILSRAAANEPGFGKLSEGYTLEAKVVGGRSDLIPEGTLRITLNAFSPAATSATQHKGRWYVRGTWVLSAANAPDPSLLKVGQRRRPPGALVGRIQAELPFNPATSSKPWSGHLLLPQTQFVPADMSGPAWPLRGDGALTLAPNRRGGSLSLQLRLWPHHITSQEKSS
jgi:hypothetical protein